MTDIQIIDKLYQELYDELKKLLKDNSKEYFNASLFNSPPETPKLPHIQFVLKNAVRNDENLQKGERKWNLLIEVDIYAQDLANTGRVEVVQKLKHLVFGMLYEKYGFDNRMNEPIPNLESKIHRVFQRYTCVYDIDSGVIYRN